MDNNEIMLNALKIYRNQLDNVGIYQIPFFESSSSEILRKRHLMLNYLDSLEKDLQNYKSNYEKVTQEIMILESELKIGVYSD